MFLSKLQILIHRSLTLLKDKPSLPKPELWSFKFSQTQNFLSTSIMLQMGNSTHGLPGWVTVKTQAKPKNRTKWPLCGVHIIYMKYTWMLHYNLSPISKTDNIVYENIQKPEKCLKLGTLLVSPKPFREGLSDLYKPTNNGLSPLCPWASSFLRVFSFTSPLTWFCSQTSPGPECFPLHLGNTRPSSTLPVSCDSYN